MYPETHAEVNFIDLTATKCRKDAIKKQAVPVFRASSQGGLHRKAQSHIHN